MFDDLEDELEQVSGATIGAREIIGALEIIGKKNPKKLAAIMKRARAMDPNAVYVEEDVEGKRRRKILPGATTVIPAGESRTILFETEETYRPERLVVSELDSEFFDIVSIKVGTSDQFASDGACPAEVFRPDAVGVDVHFKTANIGNKIAMRVTNIDSANPHTFRSTFIGTSIAGE